MKLKRMSIHEDYFNKSIYTGEIEFEGGLGTVVVKLDDTFSRKIFAVCAEAIIKTAQNMATALPDMMSEAQTPKNLLEAPAPNTHNAEFEDILLDDEMPDDGRPGEPPTSLKKDID